jgi:acetaldehyde dehydrogenase/alcohol dehydrogenase
MLEFGGLGHSAVIHTTDKNVIEAYGLRMKAGRIIVNAPSSQGAIGDIYNAYMPSLTLGCGTYGGNSVSTNVGAIHLVNIKKVARRNVNMQWFKVPSKMYFEKNSIQYLAKMPNITKAVIVTDPGMVKLGFVDKVLYYLRKRPDYVHCEIFSEVEPDPSIETVTKGAELMAKFQPDVIIALGGGSAMDAAKGMWMFYEHPDADFFGLKQKFLDIRKRIVKYPKLGVKAQLVAIPTTSGTGSEVTSFAVITDKEANMKYPLADYELTPDVAIIDPQFVMTVPQVITADTGMDVLTHAIEAYVSCMANDFTDGLAMKAIQLVFEYLPRAYRNGSDELAREKMHNASTIAGMAFANAFLGINHSLAHKLGSEFHIAHGRANTILLPHVIRYNATKPKKFTAFPKYKQFIADVRYAEIARTLGLPARTTEEGVESLVQAIVNLAKELNIPMSLETNGVEKSVFESTVDFLAERAFEDQCTTANPKLPLVSELAEIYRQAYKGV